MHTSVIGITRNEQARDNFSVTWSEQLRISQETRPLFYLEDTDEETVSCHSDSLPSLTSHNLMM